MGCAGLDFYGTIKLVNYIRLTVRDGNEPALKAPSVWEDDKYLQPVLEDDAVLFSLDELLMPGPNDATDDEANTAAGGQEEQGSDVDKLKAQLEALQQQFADYRHAVEQTLEQRWSDREDTSRSNTAGSSALPYRGKDKPGRLNSIQEVEQGQGKKEDDHYYFESYAYNGELLDP